eukprot:3783407-Lingulodinium_polyedra.AAC.1
MEHNPLGPAVAVAAGRYLGAWLVCAARTALAEGARWEQAAIDDIAFLTCAKTTQAIEDRSHCLAQHPSSAHA